MPTQTVSAFIAPISTRLSRWKKGPAARARVQHAHGLATLASFQIDAARIGDRLYRGDARLDLSDLDQHPFWPQEFAAGNLVFRCVSTALDLYAAAAWHLSDDNDSDWKVPEREVDVCSRNAMTSGPFGKWLLDLRAEYDWKLLKDLRDQFTHRAVVRDLFIGDGVLRTAVRDSDGESHDLAGLFSRFIQLGDTQTIAFWKIVDALVGSSSDPEPGRDQTQGC